MALTGRNYAGENTLSTATEGKIIQPQMDTNKHEWEKGGERRRKQPKSDCEHPTFNSGL